MLTREKPKKNYTAYIIAVLSGLFFTGVTLLLLSVIMWAGKLPYEWGGMFAFVSYGTGCLAAGITIAAIKREGGLIKGIQTALILTLLFMAVSIVTKNFTGEMFLARLTIAIVCGGVGGNLSVNN
jgi:putative membrane protein (TIGR04086 family)